MIVTKVFGILCVTLFIVQTKQMEAEEKQMLMALTEDCRKKNNATEEDMNDIFEGKMTISKAAKCTGTCAMQQYNLAVEKDDKLQLNVENLVTLAKNGGMNEANITMIQEIGEKCKSPEIVDKCDFSAEVGKCVMVEAISRGLKP